jgi:hypothetical protein
MLALGGRARRGINVVITIAAVATAAPAAGQSVGPGPTAVFSWGWNQHGEVGDGTRNHRATPAPVLGLPSVHGLQVAVKQLVSAEDSEACAVLLADGTVYTWGFNAYGELGDGTTTERLTPVLVPGRARARPDDLGHRGAEARKSLDTPLTICFIQPNGSELIG